MLQVKPVPEGMHTVTPHLVCAGAVDAGAKITMPLDGMFWGDRYGKLDDPFGHHWSVGMHVRDVTPEEMRQAMEKMGPPPKMGA